LLEQRYREDLDGAAAARVVDAALGNPLALLEIAEALDSAARRGERPLPDPLPGSTSLEGALRARVDALPEPAQQALLVAAASESPELWVLARACGALGLGTDALAGAERAALIELGERELRFQHPLVRSVVLRAAAPDRRRAAHLALAAALH